LRRGAFCYWKFALTPFLVLLLAACGFQLRGSATVPFQTLYIPDSRTGVALALKRNIEAGTNAKVVSDPKGADAILELLGENKEKIILSLSGTGRVSEFRLRYSMRYRVHDGKGNEYVPSSVVQLTRDMTYDDSQILAKEAEEQLLFRDMQADVVQQVLRRLASADRPTPKVQ
jgi:LPS-assembly lipoprotein